jgi:hypothetical protein
MKKTLFTLLFLTCFAATGYTFGPAIKAAIGGTTSVACVDTDYLPSYDQEVGSWNIVGGPTSHYDAVNEARGAESDSDYIRVNDNPGVLSDTLRVSLPGNCNVTTVRVYLWSSKASVSSITITVDISLDNTTWTSTQDYVITTGSPASYYKDYSVSWSVPTYCYVRYRASSSTWDVVAIGAMQVRLNP